MSSGGEPAPEFPVPLGSLLFGVHGGLTVVGLLLFILRSDREPVRSRNRLLVILQSLCAVGYFAAVVYALPAYGCLVEYFLYPLGIPTLVMPYLYRAFNLWYNYLLNQKTLRVNQPERDDEHAKMFPPTNPLFTKHWVLNRRWMTSWRVQVFLFILYPVIYLCVLLPTHFAPISVPNQTDCLLIPRILIALQATILILMTFFFAVILGRVKDRFYIKLELQFMALIAVPLSTLSCVLFFVPSLLPYWLSGSYATLVSTCFSLIFSLYMPTFLSFSCVIRCLHTETKMSGMGNSQSLTGKGDMFFRCLQDERLAKSFEKFCVESFSVENLFFYRHAVQFRSLRGEFLITEAYRMRYEYISPESVFEVELSPQVKERILKRMEDKDIDDTLFLAAEQEVYLTMKQGIYPLWKRSEGFKELARGGLLRTRSLLKGNQFVTPVDEGVFETEKARRQSMESDHSLGTPVKLTPPPKKPSMGTESIRKAIDQMSQRENSIELVKAASQKELDLGLITSLDSQPKDEGPQNEDKPTELQSQLAEAHLTPEEGKGGGEDETPTTRTPANESVGSQDSGMNVLARESTDMDPLHPSTSD